MVSNGDRERDNGAGDAPFAPFGPGPAGGAPYGMADAPMGGTPNGRAPMGGGPAGGGPSHGGPAGSGPNGGGPANGAFTNGAAGGPPGGNGPASDFFGNNFPGGGPSAGGPSVGGPTRGGDPFGDPFGNDPFRGDPFGGGSGAYGGPPPNAPTPDSATRVNPVPNDPGPGGPDFGGQDGDTPPGGKSRRSRRGKGDKGDKTDKTEERADETPSAPQSRVGWSPYDEGHRSRAPLWFAIGGVLVFGLFGGGIALMWNADSTVTADPAAGRQTSAPLPSVPAGKYGFADDRKTDPDGISVKEIFGSKKKFSVSGRGYEMTITSKDKKCPDGVLGDKLEKALKAAKCTQFVRGSFRDKDGVVIGTIGVANLSSSSQASKVAKTGSTANYVKPLEGKDEVTKLLGSGSGGAKIATYGHYAILYWFQNKDGSKPDSKESKRISEAINDITKATIFPALDNRALTGSGAG